MRLMSQSYLVLGAGILVAAAAGLTIFGALKRRVTIMLVSMAVMELLLGFEQIHLQPRWLTYLSFTAAAICVVSIAVRGLRGKQA
jgi:hypothetical protein